ncbi:hypothetical protein Bca4012_059156 [Brassica carinata]
MAGKVNARESSSLSPEGIPMAGRVKECYRYPFLEALNKGRVRRYFADVLYEMVDDPSTDSIVSWSQDGKSFIFWNPDKFSSDLLPKYGLTTFKTFTGRLSVTYRFRKVVESEHCEYSHDYFVRGKPELTVEIERQFKERCAPRKLDIDPSDPRYEESRERIRAFMLAKKANRTLSIS